MNYNTHPLYLSDVQHVAGLDLPWGKLNGKTVLISGASGLIGSFLIDVLMLNNNLNMMDCHIIALGRNKTRSKIRFAEYWNSPLFDFVSKDINSEVSSGEFSDIDFVIHLASNTHPFVYATEPVTTILTNVLGTRNMLEYARKGGASRFVFASSCEIYGENRGDVEKFNEGYCGYIDCNTLRAGYPESKRCGEALCQAYIRQYGIDVVIPRLSRSYGPTLLSSDTKAMSQFLRNGLKGENIVLKSDGTQYYSYTYVADAVSGLLTVLFKGECGKAYNVADEASDVRLKDLAQIIANECSTKVVFELPDFVESAGFSKATKARLDGDKIKGLGWRMRYDIQEGIKHTLDILREEDWI